MEAPELLLAFPEPESQLPVLSRQRRVALAVRLFIVLQLPSELVELGGLAGAVRLLGETVLPFPVTPSAPSRTRAGRAAHLFSAAALLFVRGWAAAAAAAAAVVVAGLDFILGVSKGIDLWNTRLSGQRFAQRLKIWGKVEHAGDGVGEEKSKIRRTAGMAPPGLDHR